MRNEKYLQLVEKAFNKMDSLESLHCYYPKFKDKKGAENITIERGRDEKGNVKWYWLEIALCEVKNGIHYLTNKEATLSVEIEGGKIKIERGGYFKRDNKNNHLFNASEIEEFVNNEIEEFKKLDYAIMRAKNSRVNNKPDIYGVSKLNAYSRYLGVDIYALTNEEIDELVDNSLKLRVLTGRSELEKYKRGEYITGYHERDRIYLYIPNELRVEKIAA